MHNVHRCVCKFRSVRHAVYCHKASFETSQHDNCTSVQFHDKTECNKNQQTFEILFEKVWFARVRGTMIASVTVVTETEHATDTRAMTTAMRFTLHPDVDVINRPRRGCCCCCMETSKTILTPAEPHYTTDIHHIFSLHPLYCCLFPFDIYYIEEFCSNSDGNFSNGLVTLAQYAVSLQCFTKKRSDIYLLLLSFSLFSSILSAIFQVTWVSRSLPLAQYNTTQYNNRAESSSRAVLRSRT